MQHRPSINFLLTGTHTIESLTVDYWSVFFNIARHYRLPRLGQQAAVELITQPIQKFLEYDEFAVEKIRQLTADQPYLIQLFCRSLVEHCNSLQKNYVTINDVNTVMSVVMETGQVHFTWIWDQSTTEEHIILSSIAQEGGDEGRFVSLADIERVYRHYDLRYNYARVMQVLKGLAEKEIIMEGLENSQWKIAVGLIGQWLRKEKLVKQVLLQENCPEALRERKKRGTRSIKKKRKIL
jgi:hypothetical protein